MDEIKIIDYLTMALIGLGGYLWKSLRDSVMLLFKKHDEDTANLAENHYDKAEVDKLVTDAVKIAKLEIENEVLKKSSR